jgi:hypothetical protein
LSAIMLLHEREGERRVAAVLAMQSEVVRRRPPGALLAQIASQLLAHNDVQGVALDELPVGASS